MSAGLFTLAHGMNGSALSSAISVGSLVTSGLLLALAYVLSGNLWFPIAIHLGWNGLQGVLLGLPVSSVSTTGILYFEAADGASPYLTGGPIGLEASLPGLAALVALAFVMAFALRRKGHGMCAGQTST
jgi:hypothetical protein